MTATLESQYHHVRLFYELAFLYGRRQAGMTLAAAEKERLGALLEAFEDDPAWSRRRFRRVPMSLPALARVGREEAEVVIRDMSPAGMLLEASVAAAVGSTVVVKIQRPGARPVQHSFPCRVVRLVRRDGRTHLALALTGIPVELRYGAYSSLAA